MCAIDTRAVAVVVLGLAFPRLAPAATITIVNLDGAGEGFNDTTPVSPVTGNSGATRGQQRLNLFNAAAAVWAAELKSSVTIRVASKFDVQTCTDMGAVLGSAGSLGYAADYPNAAFAGTWTHIALANSQFGADLSGSDDIQATFNSKLDDADPGCIGGQTWWYGIGAPAPEGQIDLFPVVLHELGHGLGFSSPYNKTTGGLFQPPMNPALPDVYLRNLYDEETNEAWLGMTDGERLASSTNTGDLVWIGTNANSVVGAFDPGSNNSNHLRMYAPNPLKPGSSVSHFDDVLSPDEFMEWAATPSPEDYATWLLMKDIGWQLLRVFNDGFESSDDDFWSNGLP